MLEAKQCNAKDLLCGKADVETTHVNSVIKKNDENQQT